jgi:ADP-ribose pyrophosphatase
MGHKNWIRKKRSYIYKAKTPDEISFVIDRISLPSGNEFDYVFVDCPYEVVYVVGLDKQDRVSTIQQYRYLLQGMVTEVPAGSPDGVESLEDGALREFEEETGYRAGKLTRLATFFPSSGITNQKSHIFMATELMKTKQKLEEGEDIIVEWLSIEEAVENVYGGFVQNVGAAYGILLVKKYVDSTRNI